MKVNYVKIGVFTVLGLAVGYGTYRLVKRLKEIRDEKTADVLTPEIEVQASNNSEKTESKKPAFDSNKVVKKGSNNAEAKTIQTAFNNIIDDAKKGKTLKPAISTSSSNVPTISTGINTTVDWSNPISSINLEEKEKRRLKVASIPKLKVDGDFGTKSVNACKIIMGTSETTYSKVRQKRIDFAKVYGLPNPY